MPSDNKIKQYSDRREQYHEKEPDYLIRIIRELAANDIDDRYQPEQKQHNGYDYYYCGEARNLFQDPWIKVGVIVQPFIVLSGQ